ncbi:MAG: alpha/beta fold hydrolase [Pseudomonadota bacterium]
MKKTILIALVLLISVCLLLAYSKTSDGELVTPIGEGTVTIDGATYEAFPLPAYAAEFVNEDYRSYFVEVEPGIKIHVLEVGSGYPLFMQHGNPTSGFLYRKVAAVLPLDRVRVIMPTLAGLGFSSKIPASQHTLENHSRWINQVLVRLGLTELIYVGQDWGGPVGMGALVRSPDLLKGMVAMNTLFSAPTEQRDLSVPHMLVKNPLLGEFMIEVLMSIFDRLHGMQGDPASIPAEVANLYGQPVLDSGNEKAVLALMRMVPDGPSHPTVPAMREIESYVDGLDVPVELVWGMNDPILGEGLPVMQEKFPAARVTETEAGHFLQEEVPTEIAGALMRIVAQVSTPVSADSESE